MPAGKKGPPSMPGKKRGPPSMPGKKEGGAHTASPEPQTLPSRDLDKTAVSAWFAEIGLAGKKLEHAMAVWHGVRGRVLL